MANSNPFFFREREEIERGEREGEWEGETERGERERRKRGREGGTEREEKEREKMKIFHN